MKKNIFFIILIIILLTSCNNQINQNSEETLKEKQDINSFIKNIDENNKKVNKEKVGLKKIEEIKKVNIKVNVNKSIINNNFDAKASGGTTDFLAFNINVSNFEENNSKVDGVIEKSYLKKDKLQIILEASNHVYSYEDANYLNDITLSNINPIDYKIISTKMGGHHVVVILDFPLGTKVDELKFNNSPVGDISLLFNK